MSQPAEPSCLLSQVFYRSAGRDKVGPYQPPGEKLCDAVRQLVLMNTRLLPACKRKPIFNPTPMISHRETP